MHSCDECGKYFDSKAFVNAHQIAHSDKYREGIKNRNLSGENNPAYSGCKATLEREEPLYP